MWRKQTHTDPLGDRLAARHLEALLIANPYRKNKGEVKAASIKFPKGTSEGVKKLVKFYILGAGKRRPKSEICLQDAYSLYFSYREGAAVKWVIEALLCGGLSYPKIAELTGYTAKSIAAYSTYYFDINGPGNAQLLIATSSAMVNSYKFDDVDNWGFKLEVLANGVDWFIRTRILRRPTKDDRRLAKELIADRMDSARLTASFLASNMTNHNNPMFTAALTATGATYSHVQKDVEFDRRDLEAAVESTLSDSFQRKLNSAIEANKLDIRDSKISAYAEDLQEEEELPI